MMTLFDSRDLNLLARKILVGMAVSVIPAVLIIGALLTLQRLLEN